MGLFFIIFFLIEASATKSWEKSRIFRCGLPLDFFRKGLKTTADVLQICITRMPYANRENRMKNKTK